MKKLGILMVFAVSQGVMASIVVTDLGSKSGDLDVSNIAVNVGDVIVAMGSRRSVDVSGSDLGSAAGIWSGLTGNGGTGNTLNSFNYLTITNAGTISRLSSTAASYQTVGFTMLSSDVVDGSLSFLGSNGAVPASGSTVAVNFTTDGLTDATDEVVGVAIVGGGPGNPLWQNRTGDAGTVLYNVSTGARGAAYGVTTDGSWDFEVPSTGIDGSDGYMTLVFAEVIEVRDENRVLAFLNHPVIEPDAISGQLYSGSIADEASGPAGETLVFSVIAGPSWLSMAADGGLSGTPPVSFIGMNSWVIEVAGGDDSVEGILKINVADPAAIPSSRFEVLEDQIIRPAYPTSVQALGSLLAIRISSNVQYGRMPYLKFDVTEFTHTVDRVTLNIHSDTESSMVDVLAVADSSWSASTLTWDNAPSRGAVIGSAQASADSWFSMDVSAYVTTTGLVSVALEEQGDFTRQDLFSSRSDKGAYLEVSYRSSVNIPPVFTQDLIRSFNAGVDVDYPGGTLDGYAFDGDGDSLTFAKVSGPDWLRVDSEGTLSGTPFETDLGSNSWVVSVSDGMRTNLATLELSVTENSAPNVLFIAIDDMNPIVGAYGNPLIQTPNMDRLAARGMLFENAHCQFSVCGPSRASLMTGLMPEQTGVTGFSKMRGISATGSRDNAKGVTNLVTIPQHFINHGYETAASGKINDPRCVGSINLDGTINEDGGSADDPPSWSIGYKGGGGSVGSSKAVRITGTSTNTISLASESVDQPASEFSDYGVATEGIAQLRTLAAGDKPFFLGVGFRKPHLPFLAPKSNWDQYDRDDFVPHPFQTDMENVTPYTFNSIQEMRGYYLETDSEGYALPITEGILPDDQQKILLHGYYACISHIDDQVGRVLDELDTLGLTSNTIVVLWGDHGFHLGDHNEWGKHTNLEQATRVPFIIRAPGFPEGEVTQAPAGLLDLYPTLCELAELPYPVQPANVDTAPEGRPLAGVSLVPVLLDPDARVRTGIMNHWGYGTYGYAYRTERYRYTEWIDDSGAILARELYDYEIDPMETINLAGLPEYEALIYQFSVSSRSEGEAGGSYRVLNSAPLPFPSDPSLPDLDSDLISTNLVLKWPEAATVTYNVMESTNLVDGMWGSFQSNVVESNINIPTDKDSGFYRVEVSE